MVQIIETVESFTGDHAVLVIDMIILGYKIESSAVATADTQDTTTFFHRGWNKHFSIVGTKFLTQFPSGVPYEISQACICEQTDKRIYNRFGNKI